MKRLQTTFLTAILTFTNADGLLDFTRLQTTQNSARAADPQGKRTRKLGKDFSLNGLIDQNGNILNDEDFMDEEIIMQFGFTSCRMVCPKTMKAITESVSDFPEDEVTVIFITTTDDKTPEQFRDTPEKMKSFLAQFKDVKAIGVSGPQENLKKLWKALEVKAPNGTHSPLSHFVQNGELKGVVAPLKFDDKKQLLPAEEKVTEGIKKHFDLSPLNQPENKSGGPAAPSPQ